MSGPATRPPSPGSSTIQQTGFTLEGIQQMHEAALRVLAEIGLEVNNPEALRKLAEAVVRVEGNRTYFDPSRMEDHLAQICPQRGTAVERAVPERLTIGIGDMCQYYHSPFSDEIALMSTPNVIEATKAAEAMRDISWSMAV